MPGPVVEGVVADGGTVDVPVADVDVADAAAGAAIRTVASEAFDTGVGSGAFAPATGLGADGADGADGPVGVGSGGLTPGAPDPATGVGTGRLTGAVAIAGATGGRLTAVGPVMCPLMIGALAEADPDELALDPVAIASVASAPVPGRSCGGPAGAASAPGWSAALAGRAGAESGGEVRTDASVPNDGARLTVGAAAGAGAVLGAEVEAAVGAGLGPGEEPEPDGSVEVGADPAEPSGRIAAVASASSALADGGASTGSSPGGVEAPATPDFACVSVIGTIRSCEFAPCRAAIPVPRAHPRCVRWPPGLHRPGGP